MLSSVNNFMGKVRDVKHDSWQLQFQNIYTRCTFHPFHTLVRMIGHLITNHWLHGCLKIH